MLIFFEPLHIFLPSTLGHSCLSLVSQGKGLGALIYVGKEGLLSSDGCDFGGGGPGSTAGRRPMRYAATP